jgi:hypothetical protein
MDHHEEREEHEGRDGGLPEMAEQFEALSGEGIGCAIEVHRLLGPGLLESAYQRCLSREWELNGIAHACEAPFVSFALFVVKKKLEPVVALKVAIAP